MIFKAALSRSATKALDGMDQATEKRVRNRIKQFAADPFDPRLSKPLAHPKGYRSSRVGAWRILFLVNQDAGLVEVLSIDSRGQVYRGL